MLMPGILEAGSDEARIGFSPAALPPAQNHPSLQPALAQLTWPDVLRAFDEMTATLRELDVAGILRTRLEPFANCRIRVVPRATEVYAEIGRMLWHPVSLHKEEPARQRAFELLERMSKNVSIAPSDPEVINAEIEDLPEGDIPFFSTVVRVGRLEGPRSTHWLPERNLIGVALNTGRAADFELERDVIRASVT